MDIFIRKAESEEDFNRILETRGTGHAKYVNNKEQTSDAFDFAPNTILLLAEDEQGKVVGTMRVLDRRYGPVELDTFLDVDSLVSGDEMPCVEVTRFWIPKHLKSKLIKFLFWKAVLQYCLANQIKTILISIRPSAARFYQQLLFFEHAGPSGSYRHKILDDLEYHVFKCDIEKAFELLKVNKHPLYDFFCKENHQNIMFKGLAHSLPGWKGRSGAYRRKNSGLSQSCHSDPL
ncbi:MAG: N-acyl amino acid synthase FeeM domain-containing protein [bacterium]